MSVSDWAGTLIDWGAELARFKRLLGPGLGRAETRLSAGAFIDGVLSSSERKTGWMLAEEAGHERPYRIQSLLGRSSWSADGLCRLVRDTVEHLPVIHTQHLFGSKGWGIDYSKSLNS